jgi:hypothetical protein
LSATVQIVNSSRPTAMTTRTRWLCQSVRIVAPLGVAAILTASPARAQGAPSDLGYRRELRAAQSAEAGHDGRAAKLHYQRALELIHGHPDVVYFLARAEMRLGHPDSAIARLRQLAAMGVVYPADSDSVFAAVRGRPAFRKVMARTARARSTVVDGAVIHALADTNFLAEDIAYDPFSQSFLVSSVHESKVIAINQNGRLRDVVVLPNDGFGVQALAVDTVRRALWLTVSSLPQALGYRAADSGQSRLLRVDIATGALQHRFDLPRDGQPHDLGDMALAPDGAAIVSDGAGGGVYIVPPTTDSLQTLVPPGTFRSPQTPALLPDGRVLVADYALGLAVIDRATHAVSWIAHADTIALSGIDGLVLRGNALFVMQNGVTPERVARLTLDIPHERITAWQVLERNAPWLGEPTHGVIVGGSLYFIANSGWNRAKPDGTFAAEGAAPPVIARVSLPPA